MIIPGHYNVRTTIYGSFNNFIIIGIVFNNVDLTPHGNQYCSFFNNPQFPPYNLK